MKKQKLDGILFIALGMIPFTFVFVLGDVVVITRTIVMSSHAPSYSIEVAGYPEGVTLLSLISKNTGFSSNAQLLVAFIVSSFLIINGIVNVLPQRNKETEPAAAGQRR
ncbi:MAG: hypothetical protein ACSHYA_20345 [Opitutaceae bacterium]